MHPLVTTIPRSIQLLVPLLPLKPMGQSRRGVTHLLEVQVRPLIMAFVPVVFVRLGAGVVPPIDEEPHKFIQLSLLLLSLKPMGQSRRGVTQTKEVQMHLLVTTI
jgi:hypothetical protein